jgi:hypothetical protein
VRDHLRGDGRVVEPRVARDLVRDSSRKNPSCTAAMATKYEGEIESRFGV